MCVYVRVKLCESRCVCFVNGGFRKEVRYGVVCVHILHMSAHASIKCVFKRSSWKLHGLMLMGMDVWRCCMLLHNVTTANVSALYSIEG